MYHSKEILDILRTKNVGFDEYAFDSMLGPRVFDLLPPYEVDKINKVVKSIKYDAKSTEKYKIIKDILYPYGFRRLAGGTNRVVYNHLEFPNIVLKVAFARTALQNGFDELRNQHMVKPFVAKTFDVTPCGTMSTHERVVPITNRQEFKEVIGDVFDCLYHFIIGKYVIDDVGTNYFMNWGVRPEFGPVILDYPDIFPLDGGKLFCNKVNEKGMFCGGEIDYDVGANHLVCYKCGEIYRAQDLADDMSENRIIIDKGGNVKMKAIYKAGNETIRSFAATDTIKKEKKMKSNKFKFKVKVGNDEVVVSRDGRGAPFNFSVNITETPVKTDEPKVPKFKAVVPGINTEPEKEDTREVTVHEVFTVTDSADIETSTEEPEPEIEEKETVVEEPEDESTVVEEKPTSETSVLILSDYVARQLAANGAEPLNFGEAMSLRKTKINCCGGDVSKLDMLRYGIIHEDTAMVELNLFDDDGDIVNSVLVTLNMAVRDMIYPEVSLNPNKRDESGNRIVKSSKKKPSTGSATVKSKFIGGGE